MLKVALVGLGKQGVQHYLPLILAHQNLSLDSVCDAREEVVTAMSDKHHVPGFTQLSDLLKVRTPDMVILAVPHAAYLDLITQCAKRGIAVLKEKPFASTLQEALAIKNIVEKHQSLLCVVSQRRFSSVYQKFAEWRSRIGDIKKIEGKYFLQIANLGAGWRAQQQQAGGGALLDMGYHFVDFLVWQFGLPDSVSAQLTHDTQEPRRYDVEDAAMLQFQYSNGNKPFMGQFSISRTGYARKEKIRLSGSLGTLVLQPHRVELRDATHAVVDQFIQEEQPDLFSRQLNDFVDKVVLFKRNELTENPINEHIQHSRLIDAAYQSYQTQSTIKLNPPNEQLKVSWPLITPQLKRAMCEQLDEAISIQGRSGIIKQLEDGFARFHEKQYALATNSGTNALAAIYYGLRLQGITEVIVPVYTFHSTVSPALAVGIKPIFCDSDSNGNIDPNEILKKITPNTGAVVITHMWGIPCDMDKIVAICEQHNLKLIEDCSHAHGAEYKGKMVGTFGYAAMWSIQGPKLVSGGEGGMVVTNDAQLYYAMLVHGQFNKRCQEEIPAGHPYKEFSLTGAGFKNRITTLAARMAYENFLKLPVWLKQKRQFADEIIAAIKVVPCLKPADFTESKPSWYAMVLQLNPELAGFSADVYCKRLIELGLTCADKPNSTRPLQHEPLYHHPEKLHPYAWTGPIVRGDERFPVADEFYLNAIKLDIWALPENQAQVDKMIRILIQAATELTLNQCFLNQRPLIGAPMKSKLEIKVDELVEQAQTDAIERIVVGAVIMNSKNKVLILKRASDDFMGGIFELPSGKQEANEAVLDALKREVKEESNLTISTIDHYINHFDYKSGSGKATRQLSFMVSVDDLKTFKISEEHEGHIWVTQQELAQFNVTTATKNIINDAFAVLQAGRTSSATSSTARNDQSISVVSTVGHFAQPNPKSKRPLEDADDEIKTKVSKKG